MVFEVIMNTQVNPNIIYRNIYSGYYKTQYLRITKYIKKKNKSKGLTLISRETGSSLAMSGE